MSSSGQPQPRRFPGRQILIADDDQINVQLLTDICRSLDLDVQVAVDGEQTLEVVRDHPVDLVLLDVMMPRLDGYEVLKQLRRRPELDSVPVILVSAVSQGDAIRKGYQLGASDYVIKPFKVGELIARLSTHLLAAASLRRADEESPWEVGDEAALRRSLSRGGGVPRSLLGVRVASPEGAIGWAVVRRLATGLRRQLRGTDSCAVLAPDRIVCLLPRTDAAAADQVRRRLAAWLDATPPEAQPEVEVTWTQLTSGEEDLDPDGALARLWGA